MASFYKTQRIKYKILVDEQNKPIGDKWSFDNENRKKMPKNVDIPKKFIFYETKHTKDLKKIINEKIMVRQVKKMYMVILLFLLINNDLNPVNIFNFFKPRHLSF